MITHLDADAVRYEGGRPVAAGEQQLTESGSRITKTTGSLKAIRSDVTVMREPLSPTATARTAGGVWGLYAVGDHVVVVHPAGAMLGRPEDVRAELEGIAGDQGRDGEERRAVGSLLPYLGGDDPGRATGAPRSQVDAGPPPTYWLSDEHNAPPASEPPSPAEQARRPGEPER